MRLVLLGPPGAGKGTQAHRLAERFDATLIGTGDIFRENVRGDTPLGREAKKYMENGELVPDSVVISLVDERLDQSDAQNGFILDGFPRTVPQAEALSELLDRRGTPLDAALFIEVPRELLTERATLRRMDRRTGQIYHLKYSPPPPGAELEHRADDREETVSRRLDEYDAMTAALLPHYEKLGLLRRVNGVGTPQEVTERLIAALNQSPPQAQHATT